MGWVGCRIGVISGTKIYFLESDSDLLNTEVCAQTEGGSLHHTTIAVETVASWAVGNMKTWMAGLSCIVCCACYTRSWQSTSTMTWSISLHVSPNNQTLTFSSKAQPFICNLQSQTLSSFRCHRKTHYFQSAYSAPSASPKRPDSLMRFWCYYYGMCYFTNLKWQHVNHLHTIIQELQLTAA